MLGIYQDVQERVYQEIKEVCSGDRLEYEHLSKLPYLTMVLKETMRLYPIGPFIGRYTTSDIQLPSCTIPADVSVLVSCYHINRDPKQWGPKADEFNPDNFLPENMSKRHPSSFATFSIGSRNCIGYRYAMMTMKIIVADALLAYKLNSSLKPEEFRHELDITLKLSNKFLISVAKRE